MKRTADNTGRVQRPAFGCALTGGTASAAHAELFMADGAGRPAYLSNVSRGSAVV